MSLSINSTEGILEKESLTKKTVYSSEEDELSFINNEFESLNPNERSAA